MIEASRDLLAPRLDVWALVGEPYNLPDWWPAYTGVQPDRRGLMPGARWQVSRGRAPGLLRFPSGEGVIVIKEVVESLELGWHDVAQRLDAGLRLANAGEGRTRATAWIDGPSWRIFLEGARGLPQQSVDRLFDLCQTTASL